MRGYPPLSDLGREHRAKPVPPEPYGLVADVDSALGQKILDVAQRQRVSHVHHHDQTDDLWRAIAISEHSEQKVSLIRIDWKGDIVCVAGASGYSANPFRVRWQLETRENTEQRNEFCRSIITRKIEATIIALEKSIPSSDKWERAMKSAYAALSRLEEDPPENISELRALEANCAASYFRSWVGMPIKWRGTSRRPIPENWHFIGQRSSPYHLAGNRNAAHAVNAILNYAYAALESKIRIKAISDGYDPTLGIMHEGSDGVCRLNPEMARMVVAKVSA
jgi:CRISPR/Cas system-associated endonuclease Cas1